MYRPLMKCGHTANAKTSTGQPYRLICDCYEIVAKPSLERRKAKCSWCDRIIDSDYNLPFFKHNPEQEYDSYYCGCGGWD